MGEIRASALERLDCGRRTRSAGSTALARAPSWGSDTRASSTRTNADQPVTIREGQSWPFAEAATEGDRPERARPSPWDRLHRRPARHSQSARCRQPARGPKTAPPPNPQIRPPQRSRQAPDRGPRRIVRRVQPATARSPRAGTRAAATSRSPRGGTPSAGRPCGRGAGGDGGVPFKRPRAWPRGSARPSPGARALPTAARRIPRGGGTATCPGRRRECHDGPVTGRKGARGARMPAHGQQKGQCVAYRPGKPIFNELRRTHGGPCGPRVTDSAGSPVPAPCGPSTTRGADPPLPLRRPTAMRQSVNSTNSSRPMQQPALAR